VIFRQLATLVKVPHIEIDGIVLELMWRGSFSMLIANQAETAMQTFLSGLHADAEFCIPLFCRWNEASVLAQMNESRDRKKKKKADKRITNFRGEGA
jgi:hypothetical protein